MFQLASLDLYSTMHCFTTPAMGLKTAGFPGLILRNNHLLQKSIEVQKIIYSFIVQYLLFFSTLKFQDVILVQVAPRPMSKIRATGKPLHVLQGAPCFDRRKATTDAVATMFFCWPRMNRNHRWINRRVPMIMAIYTFYNIILYNKRVTRPSNSDS